MLDLSQPGAQSRAIAREGFLLGCRRSSTFHPVRFLFQTAYDFPDALYRTSNPLDRAQELSRPPTVPHAVFSWQPDSTRLHLRAMALTNFHLTAVKPKSITRAVLFLEELLMAFVITTIGYALLIAGFQPMVTSKVV